MNTLIEQLQRPEFWVYVGLIAGVVLFWVGTVAALRWLEGHSDRFHRWCDERFGQESNW